MYLISLQKIVFFQQRKDIIIYIKELIKIVIGILLHVFYTSKKRKIFIIGLSRTGTTSMTKAFKELNYKSFHYPSVVFYGDKPICLKSDSLIRYDVFSDISVLPFIEIYKKKFPNSLFILTERKKEDWLNSLSKKPNLNDNINRNSGKIGFENIFMALPNTMKKFIRIVMMNFIKM